MLFEKFKNIRFAHCDPAGIVFYPRYAELSHEMVEDWFRDGLGIDAYRMHAVEKIGFPVVRLNVEYLRPSTLGETLKFTLGVAHLGNASLSLKLTAYGGEEERVRIGLKTVMTCLDTMKALPMDASWRGRFAAYQIPD